MKRTLSNVYVENKTMAERANNLMTITYESRQLSAHMVNVKNEIAKYMRASPNKDDIARLQEAILLAKQAADDMSGDLATEADKLRDMMDEQT